jgi:sugar-specific transcriptional regulator TrmB
MNKELFGRLGLTKYETEIYLVLLKNNDISAGTIASKTGLYKQACYDALNRLMEKGFVSSVLKGKTQVFRAVNPELILGKINDEAEQFQALLPELMKMRKNSDDPLNVEVYKGQNIVRTGLKDVINSLKEGGGEVLCTAIDESIPLQIDKVAVKQYEKELSAKGIREKVIIADGNTGMFTGTTTQYKTIPKEYFNPNPTQVYGNNIQIYLWGAPPHLIIIRNKELADAHRKQFNLMWRTASKE